MKNPPKKYPLRKHSKHGNFRHCRSAKCHSVTKYQIIYNQNLVLVHFWVYNNIQLIVNCGFLRFRVRMSRKVDFSR